MIKEISQIAGLLKQAPKIKEEFEKFQQKLGQISAEGSAGAGMVTVRVNGRMEVTSCNITEETLEMRDREFLEDLIKGATNQALERVRQTVAEEGGKMAGSFGGMSGMPDLSALTGGSPTP